MNQDKAQYFIDGKMVTCTIYVNGLAFYATTEASNSFEDAMLLALQNAEKNRDEYLLNK